MEQDHKGCLSFSGSSLQKEQFGSSFIPIFVKNSLVDIRLCKSLNLKSISVVLFVHLKANCHVSLHLMYFVSSAVATLKPSLHVELGEEAQIFLIQFLMHERA